MPDQADGPKTPGYMSWTPSPAGKNYDTTNREGLEVVLPILLLRAYLEGQRFTIRTGHDALEWMPFSQIQRSDWPGADSFYLNSTLILYREQESKYKPQTRYHDLEKQKMGQDTALGWYPQVRSLVSPVHRLQNDEQDGGSADKYCACNNCDFIVRDTKRALEEIVAIVRSKPNRIERGEALTS